MPRAMPPTPPPSPARFLKGTRPVATGREAPKGGRSPEAGWWGSIPERAAPSRWTAFGGEEAAPQGAGSRTLYSGASPFGHDRT